MPGLQIKNVKFSPPRYKEKAGSSRANGSHWTEITIDLHNHSGKTTFFAYSDIGGFRYHEDTGTMELILGKLPSLEGQHLAGFRQPRILPVLPGQSGTISVSLPIHVNGIQFNETGIPTLKKIDISTIHRIKLSISHDTTPFRAVATDHPQVMHQQLMNWGTRLEHSCDVRIPIQDGDVNLESSNSESESLFQEKPLSGSKRRVSSRKSKH